MKSKISIIVAMSENRVIGNENKLLWHIPGELKRFKEITQGHPIIMGRKTFESIGRVLPNRTNIIISRDSAFKVEGAVVVHSFDEAVDVAHTKEGNEEIFVIGGGQIYAAAINKADRLYLTIVRGEFSGDTFFPEHSEFSKIISQQEINEGEFSYKMQVLEK